MSDKAVDHGTSGAEDQAQASGEQTQQQKEDKVAYETYRKTVDAEKKAKAKADELARKLKEYEEKEMAANGKSQELIESLRTQLKEREEKIQNVVGDFAYRAVSSKIREEALKQGCLDVDLLLKAGSEEFGKIEVDAENGFSVNDSDLKNFFEATMKKHPMLFKKSGPKFADGLPGQVDSRPQALDKMKTDDLVSLWKNIK